MDSISSLSESSNARQGIKTRSSRYKFEGTSLSESSNARQGIKTQPQKQLGFSCMPLRPNHRMPVRALRRDAVNGDVFNFDGPNHRMPVRALRR